MKKKIISSLLVMALAGSLIGVAGCGSSSSSSGSSTGATSSTDEVTVTSYGEYTADDPYHLTFAFVEFYEQDDDARAAVEDALNEYLTENYHIEVEFLPLQYAEYQTTLQLMMSGGDALDVMPIYYTDTSSWISMGGVYDMSEFMDTADGQAIIDALGEENAYVGTMNGTLYGFPANKESVELGGLFMRADICDELGITEEYNLADYDSGEFPGECYDWSVATEIFEKVHEAYPSMTCLYMYQSDQLNRFADFDYLVDYFGGLDLQADRTSTEVVNIFETDTFYDEVSQLAEWYDAGYIYQDAATDTQGTATMMKAGNTFSYATAIKPGFLAEAEASNGCEGYVMYFKTGGGTDGYITTTNVSFFNTGIATNSEDPEMAFKFISALYSDPTVMNLWQYGIEDVNYQVLDDGTIYYVDSEDNGNFAYHQNSGWSMGNQFISYVWNDGTKEADYWDLLASHNDNAYYSPAFGFMWDSSDYSTQITALSNAWSTYEYTLLTGSCGTANLDSTIEALNNALYSAGLEEVMEAKQAQLDEWLAEQ
ncbi:MAG: ABC transporter substrate-binding protein [Clostridiales bacterium]|nr:ABC transporter substrate-binding protein [Clostridiales bacterium]